MDEKEKVYASLVCTCIKDFNEHRNEKALIMLLSVLHAAQVSVPMTVTMDKADEEQFLQAKVGDTVTTGGAIRMKPDMLTNNDGELFFPAFTLQEEAPEDYRSVFSWITMDFMNCVCSAYGNEKCAGVVVNAFSEPFTLTRPLMKFMIDREKAKTE